jgi:hypothetical protein
MSEIRYRAYRKKQPGGRYIWGVLRHRGLDVARNGLGVVDVNAG